MNFAGIPEQRWPQSAMRQHWLLLKKVLRLRYKKKKLADFGYFQHLDVESTLLTLQRCKM